MGNRFLQVQFPKIFENQKQIASEISALLQPTNAQWTGGVYAACNDGDGG